jgi:hypothetical protein
VSDNLEAAVLCANLAELRKQVADLTAENERLRDEVKAWPVRALNNALKVREELNEVRVALKAANDHLEYCNFGDSWEREGTGPLKEQIAKALTPS